MKISVKTIKYWLPAIFWMGLIFVFSSIPNLVDPLGFDPSGYIKHAVEYLIFGLFLSFGLSKSNIEAKKKIILLTLVIGFLYGASDEFHQSLVPGRNASVFDLLTDAIGALIGSIIYSYRKKIKI